jgi:hypothetical protein
MKALIYFMAIAVLLMHLSCGAEPAGSAPADTSMSITATPDEIDINGDVSTITVILTRPNGLPVDDGTIVIFTTTRGSIDREATTTNGIATNHLVSGVEIGTATVTAQTTRGGEQQTVSVEVNIIDKSNLGDATLIVSAFPTQIDPNGAQSQIQAIVIPSDGRQVEDGTPIYFSTTLGTIPSEAYTVNAIAINFLTSGARKGQALVTATTKGGASGQTTVDIQDTDAVSIITVSANPTSITPPDGTSTITAVCRDVNGDLVEGAIVHFSLTGATGVFLDSGGTAVFTNSFGEAQDILRSTTEATPGAANITATSGLTSGSVTVFIN